MALSLVQENMKLEKQLCCLMDSLEALETGASKRFGFVPSNNPTKDNERLKDKICCIRKKIAKLSP